MPLQKQKKSISKYVHERELVCRIKCWAMVLGDQTYGKCLRYFGGPRCDETKKASEIIKEIFMKKMHTLSWLQHTNLLLDKIPLLHTSADSHLVPDRPSPLCLDDATSTRYKTQQLVSSHILFPTRSCGVYGTPRQRGSKRWMRTFDECQNQWLTLIA